MSNDPNNVPSCVVPVQQLRAGGASHSSEQRWQPQGASDTGPKKVRGEADVSADEMEESLENGQLVWVLTKKRHWPAYINDDGLAAKVAASRLDGKTGLFVTVHFFGEKLLVGSVRLTQLSPIETRFLERKAALLEQPTSSKSAEALVAFCAENAIPLPENDLPADLDTAVSASAPAQKRSVRALDDESQLERACSGGCGTCKCCLDQAGKLRRSSKKRATHPATELRLHGRAPVVTRPASEDVGGVEVADDATWEPAEVMYDGTWFSGATVAPARDDNAFWIARWF